MTSSGWMRSWVFVVVAVLAVSLRVGLASVNRFSNDDHIAVVELLLKEPGRELSRDDCWQCYHVKLYHHSVAAVSRLGGPMSKDQLIQLGQWLNVMWGLATLAVLAAALSGFAFRDEVKLLVFSLAALNPRLIAINAQATNDTLVTFAGAVTCWLLSRYATGASWRWLMGACIAAFVSLLSKGSGFFVCAGLAGTLVFRLVTHPELRRRESAVLLVFAACVAAELRWGSPYRQHRERHGSAFAVVDNPGSVRAFMTAPYSMTPATLDTFATFRFFSLLEEPSILVDVHTGPASMLTHLYGRALHVRFDQWPPPWRRSAGPSAMVQPAMMVGRTQLALGLIPLFMMLLGLLRMANDAWASLRRRGSPEAPRAVALLMVFGALAAMLIAFVWSGPLLRFMKFIYFLPAGVALSYALARGMEAAIDHRWVQWALRGYVAIYVVLTCADVTFLIQQLARA